jgi:uncharacterized membrane protein YkvA (DUF1232 family)
VRALKAWRARARLLKGEVLALSFAVRHPRVPWYAKVVAACVVAYALSPIDLIPDFIPVLGYLDDLVLVPLGVWLVVRLIPADVLAECRARAHRVSRRARSWVVAVVIVGIWLLLAGLTLRWALGWGGD